METINQQLTALLLLHSEAKIYTFTYADVVCDDYGYWLGEIEKIYFGKWWEYEENIFLLENDLKAYIEENEYINDAKEYEGIIILINV